MSRRLLFVEAGALAVVLTVAGCYADGWSGTGAGQIMQNTEEALQRVHARGPEWARGINVVSQIDEPPPPGVNWAVVECPGHVILFNTTFDRPVEHIESLLVHEAFEIQHGCKDNDPVADAMAQCYHTGASHASCLEKVNQL